MKMKSAVYGELEFAEKDVVHFPEGMIGFPDSRRFILLHNPEAEPFRPLQCLDNPYLIFLTLDPRTVFKDYNVAISVDDTKALELEKPDDVTILAVVILPEDYTQATANLKAPVLINYRRMLGRQVILPENTPYSHRQPLLGS